MLAPSSKRVAHSPHRAKSPEEVELYASSCSNDTRLHASPTTSYPHNYKPSVTNSVSYSAGMYRQPAPSISPYHPPLPAGSPYQATNSFPAPHSQHKVGQQHPVSGSSPQRGGMGQTHYGGSTANTAQSKLKGAAAASSYGSNYLQNLPAIRSSSTDNELVRCSYCSYLLQ